MSEIEKSVSVLSYNVNWGFGLQRSKKSFFVDPKTKRKMGKTLTSKPVKIVIRCIVEAYVSLSLSPHSLSHIHYSHTNRNADVVCLQETHEGWEELLMRNKDIQKMYRYKWFNHPHEKFGGSGAGFLSKFPILKTRVLKCEQEGSMAPALMCNVAVCDDFRVRIVNVHLRPSISSDVPSHEEQQSFWNRTVFVMKSVGAYLSTAASVRLAEVKEYMKIVRNCKRSLPLLVLGDFNENENGSALTWLLGDAGLKRAPIKEVTWRWKLWIGSKSDRFDHILFSSSLICVSSSLVEDTKYDGSDHYGIFGRFQQV